MAWARYDDELSMNKKVGALLEHGVTGAAAIGLHVLANTWSRNQGTAGLIPTHRAGLLVGDQRLGRKLASLLADVGMFDPADGGWMVHDFDEFSDPNDDGRSAAERKKEISAKRSKAGTKGAQTRWQNDGKPDGKTMRLPQQTSGKPMAPVPSPNQEPTVICQSSSAVTPNDDDDDRIRQALEALADQRTRRRNPTDPAGYRASIIANGHEHQTRLTELAGERPEATPASIAAAYEAGGWLQVLRPDPTPTHPTTCVCEGTGMVLVDPTDESRTAAVTPCTITEWPDATVLNMPRRA